MQKLKLNLGCGSVRPEGWANTDTSLNANLQRIPVVGKIVSSMFNTVKYDNNNLIYMDLNKKWSRYSDNSVDIVYASHLFEHLSLKSASLFLKESFRCLKSGGAIRLVVPDLYKICKKYISDYEKGLENTTEYILWAINMHREGQYGENLGLVKKLVLEWQGYPHQHKYMYDEKSLINKMIEFQFDNIVSLEYGVSNYIEEIKDVEGKSESYLSIYIEGKKP